MTVSCSEVFASDHMRVSVERAVDRPIRVCNVASTRHESVADTADESTDSDAAFSASSQAPVHNRYSLYIDRALASSAGISFRMAVSCALRMKSVARPILRSSPDIAARLSSARTSSCGYPRRCANLRPSSTSDIPRRSPPLYMIAPSISSAMRVAISSADSRATAVACSARSSAIGMSS